MRTNWALEFDAEPYDVVLNQARQQPVGRRAAAKLIGDSSKLCTKGTESHRFVALKFAE